MRISMSKNKAANTAKRRFKISTKMTALVLCLIMTASLFAGCGSDSSGSEVSGDAKILIATSSTGDAFRDSLIAAIEDACDEHGVSHDTVYAETSAETQVAQIKEAKSQGYTAIVCRLVDADTALQIERAADGLPIVYVNNCPDEDYLEEDQYIYVASDENVAGTYQAEYVLDKLSSKDEINVMILEGEKSHSATKTRTDSAKNVLEASGKTINYLFVDYADWSTDLAQQYFEVFTSTGRTVDCVISNNDSMAVGAVQGMEECGIDPSTVVVTGVDATTEGCQLIKEGKMSFTVCQNAVNQGKAAVDVAILLSNGKSISDYDGAADTGYQVWVDFEKVDASNVDDYIN